MVVGDGAQVLTEDPCRVMFRQGVAAIKTAKYEGYGPDDIVATVATDGASMYETERARITARDFPGGLDAVAAGETYGEFVSGATTDHVLELRRTDRDRIFNLGYYTWVEQQGVPFAEFEARRRPEFWVETRKVVETWDRLIEELNDRTGTAQTGAGRAMVAS